MTQKYILSFLSTHKEELKTRFLVTKIGLFGSYATNSENSESDIDIAIETTKKDFFLRDDLKEYLENKFQTPVDIGYLDSFRIFYRKRIEREIIYV